MYTYIHLHVYTVVVQLLSHVLFFETPWTAAYQAPLSFTISQSLLRFMAVESVMLYSHFILCHPLLLPSVFPMCQLFASGGQSIGTSASFFPVNIQGWVRIDWFDLLAVQGTLKCLL